MQKHIYITGHKNPDSDSICASIAYAELKNKIQDVPAIPVRLGELNRETKFILDYFKVPIPLFIDTVRVQVSDIKIDTITPISKDISMSMAFDIMKKQDVKSLPVVDDNNELIGIVTSTNLFNNYINVWDANILYKSKTSIENILETLSAQPLHVNKEIPLFKGNMSIVSKNNVENVISEGDIAICEGYIDLIKEIIKYKPSLIIIASQAKVDEDTLKLIKNNKITTIITAFNTFDVARLLPLSIPVTHVMTTNNLVKFSTDDFLEDTKTIMGSTRYRSYPVVDKNNKAIGTISRYHLITHIKKQVILVDHNERTQSVDGIEDAELLEIIDHHRIADLQTGNPIYFRNEPVGSTSTIVASMFFEHGIKPSKKIAGLLCAAIISDTLLFRSPTTTLVDKMILERLKLIAGIDADSFSKEMFQAGTSLKGRRPDEIFLQDFKVFTIDHVKIGVSQVSILGFEEFHTFRDEIQVIMNEKVKNEKFELLVLMLTDILGTGSEVLLAGERIDIIEKAFRVETKNNSIFLPGVVSRKKQIIPQITSALSEF